jgi:hypothetical protein
MVSRPGRSRYRHLDIAPDENPRLAFGTLTRRREP